jgi:hypothetical protein
MSDLKRASLVFFYFGEESYVNRLAQETVPLKLALEGYDKAVLLHHATSAGPFKVSDADAKHADVVDIPTKENLVKHLNELGASGYEVDLYVFSHGSDKCFRVSKGTYGENGSVSASYLETNVKQPCLRAVWQCNCYGASMNPTWEKLGAKATAGSRFVNFYPTRFKGFMNAWKGGATFAEALASSDTALVRTPVQAFLMADAAARAKEWGGNLVTALQVLGNNEHAEKYFKICWLEEDWQVGKSGKQNANYSSFMVVAGDRALKR